ncbi:MAG: GntR family transcriptional regulator [Clostridia bacterium]|jgi:GntR family transcriptional regulator
MLQLDLKSRKSIYEQVMDQLKEQIMTGQMATGEKLPSVRELSKSITVNPNTVQKAYRELERQGYVYTTSGVGTFVADRSEIHADLPALQKAQENLDDAFRQLLFLGIGYEKAKNLTMQIIERRRPDHDKN